MNSISQKIQEFLLEKNLKAKSGEEMTMIKCMEKKL